MDRVADIWLNEITRVYDFVPDPEKFWRKRLDEMKEVTRTAEGYVYEEDGLIKAFNIYGIWLLIRSTKKRGLEPPCSIS